MKKNWAVWKNSGVYCVAGKITYKCKYFLIYMSQYTITFVDNTGTNEEIDLSPFVISPLSRHMMGTLTGITHMVSRPTRSTRCRCRALQSCVHCNSMPNPLEVMGIASQPPKPKPLVSNFKAEGTLGECSICQEMIQPGQMVSRLPCTETVRHAFHEKCITPWLQQHNSCPNCRAMMC